LAKLYLAKTTSLRYRFGQITAITVSGAKRNPPLYDAVDLVLDEAAFFPDAVPH
jgi:hypothetical protein